MSEAVGHVLALARARSCLLLGSEGRVNAVTDLLARFALALDDHDWDGVAPCLADTVRRDYSR